MTASTLPTWLNRHIDSDILRQKSRYTTKHYQSNHVAMIFHGRKILAIGQNRVADKGYTHREGVLRRKNTIHAEVDVIRSLGDISKLRGATLVVIRLAASGIINSLPCPSCHCFLEKCVREYGLRGWIHS
jgi:hypothetical protein